MDQDKKLVSIIMSVYNGAETIYSSIESVINQSYKDLELIIIDDGSLDGTKEVVNSISDVRIKYFYQTNQGVSSARNRGLDEMKGNFFCFLDADDILPPDSISSRISVFIENPDVKFVDGRVEQRDLNSSELLRTYAPSFTGNPLKELLLLNDSCFCGQTWLIRNDDQKKLYFRTELTHGEDLTFFIDQSKLGGKYMFTDDLILIYNRHGNSAMSNLDGLGNFYLDHLNSLNEFVKEGVISEYEKKKVTGKIKQIMVKSYLKKGNIAKSLKFLFLRS